MPIPGTTKLHRLREITAAADLQLTPAEVDELAAASGPVDLTADRYPQPRRSGSTAEQTPTPEP